MKHLLISVCIVVAVTIVACSKQRSCACTYKNTTITTYTPRSAASATTTVDVFESGSETTFSKIKKSDLRKYQGCLSGSSKSTDNYTVTVNTPTVLTANGFTFTSTVPVTADVNVSYLNETTCAIK